jgi:hypothetical protein
MNTKKPVECVSQRQEKDNQEIYKRNIPSQLLQPYLSVRPVMTKYSYFPLVDPRKEPTVALVQQPTYSTSQVFNPANRPSPWSGFASSVNTESELYNQIFALQKCSQSVYVPSSQSDLYKSYVESGNSIQNHPLLFQHETFAPFNPNPSPSVLGANMFHNNTRSQIQEIQTCDYGK